MPAPKGNEYWKMAVNPGRNRIFATPADLWEAAIKYFNWCSSNPWMKNEQLKKPIVTTHTTPKGRKKSKAQYIVQIPTERPFTYAGMCAYLSVSRRYFNSFKAEMEKKKEDASDTLAEEFLEVLARIDDIMHAQKLEGALVGTFNPALVASELKMAKYEEVSEKVIIVKGGDE